MGRPQPTALKLAVYLIAAFVAAVTPMAAATASQAKPGCDERCGDLQIPYPFGVKKGCYLNEDFFIACNTTHFNPPQGFLIGSNLNVTSISISGEINILQFKDYDCFTSSGDESSNRPTLTISISTFTISHTKNKFIAIGCDTYAFISGDREGQHYRTGCISSCEKIDDVTDGECSGIGCCQLEIPKGLKNTELAVGSFSNQSSLMSFNPCGYALVIEEQAFNFSSQFLRNFSEEKVPLVLDWAINNSTCLTAENKDNCICGQNSRKVNTLADGSEYRCECFVGFEGNPYLPQGCQDIDECKVEQGRHECRFECRNTVGGFTCNCPEGYEGDGRRGGDGCTRKSKPFVQIIVGVCVGVAVLLIAGTWLYLGYRKWKFIKLKEKFFEENGGLMLQQHLSQWQSPSDMVRIFTQKELEKATNKYDDSAVVGTGGYGTVYRGVLDDGLVVAIKKSKLANQSQTAQFINEVVVLSQINHRNVVKLLGCCLETQVPLLVYEFITNGTLFEHIHDKSNHASLSWDASLKIASEAAGVISYLHSSASTPIIHRDIKSTNILLDDNNTAKVSDFGASKLVPLDQTQLSTMVQGTLGYLDPEYLLTSELTEKSDVYSFGIVLLELLTGKKAVSFDGPEVERNLAMYVVCAMKEDRLEEVIENGMATQANFEQIREAAKLAIKCLRIKGEERPTMKEVAMELEGLRLMHVEHPWVNDNVPDVEGMTFLLQQGATESSQFAVTSSINVADNSLNAQILARIHDGR